MVVAKVLTDVGNKVLGSDVIVVEFDGPRETDPL